MVEKLIRIVSGGQTGVDRAALDFALAHGMPCGGWCPKGRRAVDGPLASRYPLRETSSDGYAQRTRMNVRDSDATLILNLGRLDGGSAFTRRMADKLGRPVLVANLEDSGAVGETEAWLDQLEVTTLNIAGPREEKRPGIGQQTGLFLKRLFRAEEG